MSTVFTADPTSGLAPSSVPDPTTVPILTLPADGDADNAASVAQAFKASVNETAWLKAPRANAASGFPSVWATPIRRYRNARLQDRHYVDHLGFPMGRIVAWEQNWDTLINGTTWPSTGDPWSAFPGTGAVIVRKPSNAVPTAPLFCQLKVTPPTAAATASYISRIGSCVPADDMALGLKFAACLDAVGTNRTTIIMGMLEASSAGSAAPAWGAWFSKANGDVNWQCNVSGAAPVDSGLAPIANTFVDFKIEILGQNAADDSAARVLFYIGGVLKANITATITPSSTDPMGPAFSATTTTTGGAAVSLYVAPVKFRHNTVLNAL